MNALAQRLKDPRVPGVLLLALLSMGGTVPMPMGGVENATLNEISVTGRANGAHFDATLGPGSTLWVVDEDPVEVDIYDQSGGRVREGYTVQTMPGSRGRVEVSRVKREGTQWGVDHPRE